MRRHTNYVLGFAFDVEKRYVVLIEKQKPLWQKGKLNGVGGKIEPSDKGPESAMVREFQEETGVTIPDWRLFNVMNGEDFTVYCFVAFSDDIFDVKTMESESVDYFYVDTLQGEFRNCISNIPWLVGMCLDEDMPRMFSETHYREG